MGALGGGFLRLFQTFLYLVAFGAASVVLGFFSYFLAVLSNRNEYISKDWKAVEGISGVAVVYTIFAVLLTCCLGGVSFFGFIAVILNVLFCGGFIAIAILTRQGAHKCAGTVNTPLGSGNVHDGSGFGSNGFGTGNNEKVTYQVTYGTACRYNKAVFACAIIGAGIFLILALVQIALVRHHKKEKAYGPSPANNYTSGSAGRRKFWNRKRGAETAAGAGAIGGAAAAHHHHNHTAATRDTEMGVVDNRPSHDTGFTGSTVANGNTTLAKDETAGHHAHSASHGRYFTQPEGSGVNPYGYDQGTNHTVTAPGYNTANTTATAPPARNF
ncbi:hypothetical protein ANO11243_014610 [Dothideomycetidae sp. 11243]|nr:hypothetical protein ANO11243_014610 [fungal sp. No.11243]